MVDPFNPIAVIEGWLADKAKSSKHNFRNAILVFVRFLDSEDSTLDSRQSFLRICNATVEDIRRFALYVRELRHPSGAPLSPQTHRGYIMGVRSFYNYLEQIGYIKETPFLRARIKVPSTKNIVRPHPIFSTEQVRMMFKAVNLRYQDGIRDYAMLALLFGAALRAGEASKLTMMDITEQNGKPGLWLRDQKNGRSSLHYIAEWVAKAVDNWKQVRLLQGARDDDPFLGLAREKIHKHFRTYARRVGLPSASPHSARRTAIVHLLRAGVPHRMVKIFSRHRSIEMVFRYDEEVLQPELNPGINLSYDELKPKQVSLISELVPIHPVLDPNGRDVH